MSVSKKSLENLRPPKKGEPSRNPKGRPKKEYNIPDILRRQLADQDNFTQDERTNLEAICIKAINQAKGGDKDARNWIADRTEGKAIDRIITQQADDELILI